MSDDVVHRRMPKSRKVTIVIMLAMAAANSITLVITLIRPVPQFSISGVMMQLGAKEEATLARRDLLAISADNATEHAWSLQYDSEIEGNVWQGTTMDSSDLPAGLNTRIEYTQDKATSRPLPSLRLRSPCRDDECGNYFTDPRPKPSGKPSKLPQKEVKADAYIEMVMGLLGICIMRVDGITACSKAAFSPDYKPVFEQANLDTEVVAQLPSSPGAAPASLILGTALYVFSVLLFTYTLTPPFQLTTSDGLRKSMDSRHQMALAISSMTTTVGLILVLIPTFVLRNAFIKTVKAIPAINQNLQVQLGSGFTQLYVVCVLGGLILVQCLMLISEDLRFPWWYTQSHGSIRRNPFDTTERGLVFTHENLPKARLDQRYWDTVTGGLDWVEKQWEDEQKALAAQQEAERQAAAGAAQDQDTVPSAPAQSQALNAMALPRVSRAGYRTTPATGQV